MLSALPRLTMRSARTSVRTLSTSAPRMDPLKPGAQPGMPNDNPTAAEAEVHADRHAKDPLSPSQKVGGSTTEGVVDQVKKAAESVAETVKDAVGAGKK